MDYVLFFVDHILKAGDISNCLAKNHLPINHFFTTGGTNG